jgi:hypothetical protein
MNRFRSSPPLQKGLIISGRGCERLSTAIQGAIIQSGTADQRFRSSSGYNANEAMSGTRNLNGTLREESLEKHREIWHSEFPGHACSGWERTLSASARAVDIPERRTTRLVRKPVDRLWLPGSTQSEHRKGMLAAALPAFASPMYQDGWTHLLPGITFFSRLLQQENNTHALP